VLTVLAVVMGVAVLAAVVFMPPARPRSATQLQNGSTAADLRQPTFLDQPVRGVAGAPTAEGQGSAPGEAGIAGASVVASAAGDGLATPRMTTSDQRATTTGSAEPTPYGALYEPSYVDVDAATMRLAASVDPHQSAGQETSHTASTRARAFEAALAAPLVASATSSADANLGSSVVPVDAGDEWTSLAAGSSATPRAISGIPASRATSSAPERLLADATAARSKLLRLSVDSAPGPYALQAGTMIPAVLITEISSDLPGEVLAQISRDVYDSRTQQELLVPKGSRLLGTYDQQIAVGHDRLLLAWTRIIFPDGRSISLPGLQTKDQMGAGGLRDQVDQHTTQVFGTASLLSLIGAGVQLSQPNGGYGGLGAYPSPGQIAAGAAGQQLAEVATQMLRRNMDVQPTIHIRQGMPFNVFLNADLVFAEPYGAQSSTTP
jgi:type IV secretory pathway VirB10-like protein